MLYVPQELPVEKEITAPNIKAIAGMNPELISKVFKNPIKNCSAPKSLLITPNDQAKIRIIIISLIFFIPFR